MTREDAIDVLKHNYPSACFTDLCEAVEMAIQALSAEPEIIRCKDCENWQTDWSYREIDGTVEYHYCGVMDVATPCDGYCYQGERKYD